MLLNEHGLNHWWLLGRTHSHAPEDDQANYQITTAPLRSRLCAPGASRQQQLGCFGFRVEPENVFPFRSIAGGDSTRIPRSFTNSKFGFPNLCQFVQFVSQFRFAIHQPHCLLTPALSSRGGEGEDSGAFTDFMVCPSGAWSLPMNGRTREDGLLTPALPWRISV